MIRTNRCPYCGKVMGERTKEHFFPKSIFSNSWDFVACYRCNNLKNNKIVYPGRGLLMMGSESEDEVVQKFFACWRMAGPQKYSRITPYLMMRDRFLGLDVIERRIAFTKEEMEFYGLYKIMEVIKLYKDLEKEIDEVYALIMNGLTGEFVIVHRLPFEFDIPMDKVSTMNIHKVPDKGSYKWIRIIGQAADYLWTKTQDCTESFKNIYKWCGGN